MSDPMKYPRNTSGFTMIELLVVIVVLAILIGLAVSVGKYVTDKARIDETRATQTLVMTAVEMYHDVRRIYPQNRPADTTSKLRNANLLDQLKSDKGSLAKLNALPSDAVDTANSWILDGFGRPFDYSPDGGLGGRPVLISPGPDGKLSTDAGGKPEYDKDNIRSDQS